MVGGDRRSPPRRPKGGGGGSKGKGNGGSSSADGGGLRKGKLVGDGGKSIGAAREATGSVSELCKGTAIPHYRSLEAVMAESGFTKEVIAATRDYVDRNPKDAAMKLAHLIPTPLNNIADEQVDPKQKIATFTQGIDAVEIQENRDLQEEGKELEQEKYGNAGLPCTGAVNQEGFHQYVRSPIKSRPKVCWADQMDVVDARLSTPIDTVKSIIAGMEVDASLNTEFQVNNSEGGVDMLLDGGIEKNGYNLNRNYCTMGGKVDTNITVSNLESEGRQGGCRNASPRKSTISEQHMDVSWDNEINGSRDRVPVIDSTTNVNPNNTPMNNTGSPNIGTQPRIAWKAPKHIRIDKDELGMITRDGKKWLSM